MGPICRIIIFILIGVVGGIVFYLYGVGKDVLESDDPKYKKIAEEFFEEDVEINEGVVEYNTDAVDANDNGNDDIIINDIHFSLDNIETMVTGGIEYAYLPVDSSVDQKFVITIPKRNSHDSEGKRDFYKSMIGNVAEDATFGEWADKNNDEFGFYIGLYDGNANISEYQLLDIANEGAFHSSLRITTEGKIKQIDLEKIITDFRQASMSRSVEFKINNTTLRPPIDSTRNIEFHFDQEDFIFDVTGGFEYGDEHKRYILSNEKLKYEKARYMLISKLEKPVYDSADAGCEYMKSGIHNVVKVADILFESDEKCGFFLSGVVNGKNVYEWYKVAKGGMHGYVYHVEKNIGDELPVGVIDKITNKFKSFEY